MREREHIQPTTSFWSVPPEALLQSLASSPAGLSGDEAAVRLERFGPNLPVQREEHGPLSILLDQFKSPIILILLACAVLSFFLEGRIDATIIGIIVLVSGLLGFWQEYGASHAMKQLLALVKTRATVLRDGARFELLTEQVVPGDVVLLGAGDHVPGDCRILESKDLFVDEATLTGESYPREKLSGVLPETTALAKRTNTLFQGTHVVSGSATAVVVHTGAETEFGRLSKSLRQRPPETEFEHGVARFGALVLEATLLLVLAIFAVNVALHRPVLQSLLFALALAVGLTPQLLPAIIGINLAKGAKQLAAQRVIVKRLAAIENFGSMDLLCSDKTGTLTEGVVHVQGTQDVLGNESEKLLFYCYVNAKLETGFSDPIDEAIRKQCSFDLSKCRKLDEVPYDFLRKRLSVLADLDGKAVLITKGALKNVLAVCTLAELPSGEQVPLAQVSAQIQERYQAASAEGYRVLGVAYRMIAAGRPISAADEHELVFLGCLILSDPPKAGIVETIQRLNALGVSLKVITGDNALVAAHVGREVGFKNPRVLTGPEMHDLTEDALVLRVRQADVFAEVEPNQKARILRAARRAGHVVGFLGDGINDAPALHSADVGISVDTAADIARESADIVLLEKDLDVLVQGVTTGRSAFANTFKYVFMATSANFGNMFSMAGASLFLPFLPMLPMQVLLTNLLTDLPEMTIATDRVDPELTQRPRRWDVAFIRRFMIVFGLTSSVFDYCTFGVLALWLKAAPEEFRTGWFIESVISASMAVLVVRTRRPFFRSMPSRPLVIATIAVAIVTIALPFTPLGQLMGFVAVPLRFFGAVFSIIALYMLSAEIIKRAFYRPRPMKLPPAG